jgi:BirA family biotin operon repressor/biotin-[acetyl-CoA-carboxylase] ligase
VSFWRLEVFDELGSTSDFCVERAKGGEAAGLAVLAKTQTAGRGSRGRVWIAPPGNVNLSVLLRPENPVSEAGVFPLLAGLAVAEAVEVFLPRGVPPTLKWPNDVLLNGAKLAGMLIDAAPVGTRLEWLVLGIGVNLRHAPEIAGRQTTTLAAYNGQADAEIAAGKILERLGFWLGVLASSGAGPVQAAWLERAHPLGTALEIHAASGIIKGEFAGLSAAGELLLARGQSIERINTGEILLGSGAR